MTPALGLVLAVGLLTAAALLGALLAGLWWFDRCDDEPVGALVVAGGWGVLAAAAVGLGLRPLEAAGLGGWLVSGDTGSPMAVLALLALVGQGLLAVGVALLARRVDGPTDGMLLGCAAGLGWAVCGAVVSPTEIPTTALAETAIPALSTSLTLAVAGVVASAVATGTFGGSVGLARLSRRVGPRLLWVGGGLTSAVLLDAGWRWSHDAVTGSSAGWPVGLLLLVLAVALGGLLVWLLVRAEGRVLAEELEEELAWRVVPAWVVRTIPSYRSRVRGDWWPERRTRVVVARLISRLALRKRAVRGLPSAAAGLAALEVGRLRSRTRSLLLPEAPGEE